VSKESELKKKIEEALEKGKMVVITANPQNVKPAGEKVVVIEG